MLINGVVGLIVPMNWTDGKLLHFVLPSWNLSTRMLWCGLNDAQKGIGYPAYTSAPDKFTGDSDLVKFLPAFLSDIFVNATQCYVFPLIGSTKAKAKNTLAEAKKFGTRGNDLSTKVVSNLDKFEVSVLGNVVVDTQVVSEAEELQDNDYVVFTKSGSLSPAAASKLTGGVDGTYENTDIPIAVERLGDVGVNVVCPMVALADQSVINAGIEECQKYGHWMHMIGAHT